MQDKKAQKKKKKNVAFAEEPTILPIPARESLLEEQLPQLPLTATYPANSSYMD